MKIVFLGAKGLGADNATGQTLRQLYSGIPDSDVLEVAYSDLEIASGRSAMKIPTTLAPIDHLLRMPVVAAYALGRPPAKDNSLGLNDAVKMESIRTRMRLRRDIRAIADLSPLHLSSRFLAPIRAFGPTLIHTLLGNTRQMKLAILLSRALDVPIVPHFMDDWPSSIYSNREVCGSARKYAQLVLADVLRRAPLILCIGERMADEYTLRYKRPTRVARYGFDGVAVAQTRRPNVTDERRLIYVGGAHLGRDKVLHAVADALEGKGWRLEVYSKDGFSSVHPNVHVMPEIEEVDVSRLLSAADALLFVESFDPGIAQYTRLSVSTKVAQYVGANRPTVIVGPSGQASVELLENFLQCSFSASSTDAITLNELVASLGRLESYDLPERVVPSTFTSLVMQQALMNAFREAQQAWLGSESGRLET